MAKSSKPNYQSWPKKSINVVDLFLDSENIRLDVSPKLSQEALINDLFTNENAFQILESIAIDGFFPDEIPVVIEKDDKVIVIDGNRRVSALKALMRPEIVPHKEKTIKELIKANGPSPRKIDVVVAPSREAVQNLLANKHTQNTKRPWRPLRQAYFYKAQLEGGKSVQNLRDDYPNVDISKFLRLINVHKIAKSINYETEPINEKVARERSFPATTIERLYNAPSVRRFLGFEFSKDGELKIEIERKEFEKGFRKIITDVVEKNVDSRTLNTEQGIKEYLKNFPKVDTPNKTKTGTLLSSKNFKEIETPTTKRSSKLAPKDIEFTLKAPAVRRMLQELQKITYRQLPNASHDLLRSFLECALKAYFEQTKHPVKPSSGKYVYLSDVLEAFSDEMKAAKNIKLYQVARRVISNNKMQSYSAEFFNAANHNHDVFVIPDDVETAWDMLEPLLRYVVNPPKNPNV